MDRPLVGRLVLVVEDEPIIALDIVHGLTEAGARVVSARTLADALNKAQEPELSAAVLDHKLSSDDTSEVCTLLEGRNIPFVLYSGFSRLDGACGRAAIVPKPASPHVLVTTLVGLLRSRPIAN